MFATPYPGIIRKMKRDAIAVPPQQADAHLLRELGIGREGDDGGRRPVPNEEIAPVGVRAPQVELLDRPAQLRGRHAAQVLETMLVRAREPQGVGHQPVQPLGQHSLRHGKLGVLPSVLGRQHAAERVEPVALVRRETGERAVERHRRLVLGPQLVGGEPARQPGQGVAWSGTQAQHGFMSRFLPALAIHEHHVLPGAGAPIVRVGRQGVGEELPGCAVLALSGPVLRCRELRRVLDEVRDRVLVIDEPFGVGIREDRAVNVAVRDALVAAPRDHA